jgi:hypothetical protein
VRDEGGRHCVDAAAEQGLGAQRAIGEGNGLDLRPRLTCD